RLRLHDEAVVNAGGGAGGRHPVVHGVGRGQAAAGTDLEPEPVRETGLVINLQRVGDVGDVGGEGVPVAAVAKVFQSVGVALGTGLDLVLPARHPFSRRNQPVDVVLPTAGQAFLLGNELRDGEGQSVN